MRSAHDKTVHSWACAYAQLRTMSGRRIAAEISQRGLAPDVLAMLRAELDWLKSADDFAADLEALECQADLDLEHGPR
jgi:hypothetical protein